MSSYILLFGSIQYIINHKIRLYKVIYFTDLGEFWCNIGVNFNQLQIENHGLATKVLNQLKKEFPSIEFECQLFAGMGRLPPFLTLLSLSTIKDGPV